MGMKASDPFKFEKKWWSKNKPLTLKSTGLGAILGEYDEAKKECDTMVQTGTYKGNLDKKQLPFDDAIALLKGKVTTTAKKAKNDCNKTLHKDTIAVLDKFEAACKKEIQEIEGLRNDFDHKYNGYFTNLKNKAEEHHGEAEQSAKKVEELVGLMEMAGSELEKIDHAVALGVQQGRPKTHPSMVKAVQQGELRYKKLTEYDKEIAAELVECNTAKSNIAKCDRMNDLTVKDRAKIQDLMNDVTEFRNDIMQMQNAVKAVVGAGKADLESLKNRLDGKGLSMETVIERLTLAEATLKGYSEDSRRYDNNITGPTGIADRMGQALAEKSKGDEAVEAAAKKLVIPYPQDEWKARVRQFLLVAKDMAVKNKVLLKKAQGVFDKAAGQLTDGQRQSDNIKGPIDKMTEYIKAITAYEGTLAAHTEMLVKAVTKVVKLLG